MTRWRNSLIKKSVIFLILSIGICSVMVACGKKGNPVPKKLPEPGGIRDLSGEIKDGVLFLSFTIPAKNQDGTEIVDLTGFKVLKSCTSCNGVFEPFREVLLDADRGFTVVNGRVYIYDDDLVDNYQYAYRVHPVTARGMAGDGSNTFSIRWQDPPSVPATTVSVKENDGKVELSWVQENGFLYNVYRHEGDTYPLFPVNREVLPKPYFVDTGLKNGQKYVYDIRKVVEQGAIRKEGPGLKVGATPKDLTAPSMPQQVKAQRADTAVQITWLANKEGDLAGYNVYRLIRGKGQKLNQALVSDPLFVDRRAGASRYPSYYVTAVDTAGNESEQSREVTVIPTE